MKKTILAVILIALSACNDEDFVIMDNNLRINHLLVNQSVDLPPRVHKGGFFSLRIEGVVSKQENKVLIEDAHLDLYTVMQTKGVFTTSSAIETVPADPPIELKCFLHHKNNVGKYKTFIEEVLIEDYKASIANYSHVTLLEETGFDGATPAQRKASKKEAVKTLADKVRSYENKFLVFKFYSDCLEDPYYVELKMIMPKDKVSEVIRNNDIDHSFVKYSISIYQRPYMQSNLKILVAEMDNIKLNGITNEPTRMKIIEDMNNSVGLKQNLIEALGGVDHH